MYGNNFSNKLKKLFFYIGDAKENILWVLNSFGKLVPYFIIAKYTSNLTFIEFSLFLIWQDLCVLVVSNSSFIYFLADVQGFSAAKKKKIIFLFENFFITVLIILVSTLFFIFEWPFSSSSVLIIFSLGTILRINGAIISRYLQIYIGMYQNLKFDLLFNIPWQLFACFTVAHMNEYKSNDLLWWQIPCFSLILFLFYKSKKKRFSISDITSIDLKSFLTFYKNTAIYKIPVLSFPSVEKIALTGWLNSTPSLLASYLFLIKGFTASLSLTSGLISSRLYITLKKKRSLLNFQADFLNRCTLMFLIFMLTTIIYYFSVDLLHKHFSNQFSSDHLILGVLVSFYVLTMNILNMLWVYFEKMLDRLQLYLAGIILYSCFGLSFFISINYGMNIVNYLSIIVVLSLFHVGFSSISLKNNQNPQPTS